MPDTPYSIPGGSSMETSRAIMNTHMSDSDQHTTTSEKTAWTYPNWSNIQNKPNFADISWKGIFPDRASVLVNTINDTFVVLNDGDGKGALYITRSLVGTWQDKFEKLGDVDFAAPNWSSILSKPILILADGSVPMTGLLTLSGTPTQSNHAATKAYVESIRANPNLTTVIENRTSNPVTPLTGQIWIRTDL